jgi:hypothetical protein
MEQPDRRDRGRGASGLPGGKPSTVSAVKIAARIIST